MVEKVSHICRWPGCKTEILPELWACATHWYMLPDDIRDRLWEVTDVANARHQRKSTSLNRHQTRSNAFYQIERQAIRWIMKTKGAEKELEDA